MAIVNGDNYDHVDIVSGGNTVRHMIEDKEARTYLPQEHLGDYQFTNKTAADLNEDVEFIWHNHICTMNGTAKNSLKFNVILNSPSSIPEWIKPGDGLYVKVDTSNDQVRFNLCWYLADGKVKYDYFTKDDVCLVPQDAVGIIIRLSVLTGAELSNDTIEVYLYENDFINKEVKMMSNAISHKVGFDPIDRAPMLTITDDDGNLKEYTDLYPWFKARRIPFTPCIPFSNIDRPDEDAEHRYVTTAQVKEMHANGMEIAAHTYSHITATKKIDPDTGKEILEYLSEVEYEEDYRKAKYNFATLGINTNLIVYAGSTSKNENAYTAAQRVYSGGLAGGSKIVDSNTDRYFIPRYMIDGGGTAGNTDGHDLAALKALIDTLIASGGWMIWCLHTSSSYWDDTKDNIFAAIEYAIQQDVPIVTTEYGFKKYFRTL